MAKTAPGIERRNYPSTQQTQATTNSDASATSQWHPRWECGYPFVTLRRNADSGALDIAFIISPKSKSTTMRLRCDISRIYPVLLFRIASLLIFGRQKKR